MRWFEIFQIVLISTGLARATQVPFASLRKPHLEIIQEANWGLDESPAINATGNLIFETVSSLLQHWPNTRYRNGHTIVPGIIPPGTLLYHGTNKPYLPDTPEWVATDSEHAHIFCDGSEQSGCWQITLAPTRPLRILYFDGTSASKMEDGPMDSQDVVTWGEPKPDWWFKERERITDLCDWGKAYTLDGFVRMEMDFEVMLCDFTSGVKIISALNLAVLPDDSNEQFSMFEAINAGKWHNRYPGEERVQLDLTRLVSFYDIGILPSLVRQRAEQERWDHRIFGADAADLMAFRRHLENTLTSQQQGSGADWKTLFRTIIKRYADKLELIQYLLNDTDTQSTLSKEGKRRAAKIQLQLRTMLTPYILHSSIPLHLSSSGVARHWAEPIFMECATAHTSPFVSEFMATFTSSEALLLKAVQETVREICRVTTRMWAEGVEIGLDPYLPVDVANQNTTAVIEKWKADLNALILWLDWSVWVKCRPACVFEEICYLPTWPIGFRHRRRPGAPQWPNPPEDNDDWKRPQPRCIRRLEPFGI
ncbi:hypothetical protein BJ138DRAFT_1180191 [Hygrophoropsis aurantiaca]|uniref:Uncharacterized protein n=1 Tax=Hygrophoropsis aurantiaca TaxID=72124 RepID=A0ACB8ABB3_9AGAM|nr:hypothetical protein BJ138DRAFT_1180191 [Hygrophoropsis aurantiaca]